MIGIDTIISTVLNIVNKFVPDKTKQAEMAHEVLMSKLNGELKEVDQEFELLKAQIEANKVEAGSTSIFVAGWRPSVGWICAAALGYSAVFEPMLEFVSVVIFDYTGKFPVIDTTITLQVLFALLGIAGYRTFEKYKGVAR